MLDTTAATLSSVRMAIHMTAARAEFENAIGVVGFVTMAEHAERCAKQFADKPESKTLRQAFLLLSETFREMEARSAAKYLPGFVGSQR